MDFYAYFMRAIEWLKKVSAVIEPFFTVIFLCMVGVWFLFLSIKRIQRKNRERKIEKLRREKERAFTLPDRENTFVRERLNGVLSQKIEDDVARYDVSKERLRLEYVRRLLSKIKAMQISVADRLEANRLSRTITEQASKEKLTLQETYVLNECFLSVLKLAAKYAA